VDDVSQPPGDPEVAAIARRFGDMAEQVFTRMALYKRLCEGVAADPEVAARLLLAPEDQRVPNLLLAAVHDVLLSGLDDPLADWFPSIPATRGAPGHRVRPVGQGADDPWPRFRALALEHPGVAELLATRTTQTNEIGRTVALVPALYLASVAAGSEAFGGVRPLGMVDVGASAGLNLRLDAYGYRYRLAPSRADVGESSEVVECVGPRARLRLECQLRGPGVPALPTAPQPLESAVGLDRQPIDVLEPADARWLVACQWPEETERLDRLREAMRLAEPDVPVVERGDLVDDIAPLIARVPPRALPVVTATWTLAYLSVDRQQQFMDRLERCAVDRDLALVYAEQPERVPGLPLPPRPDGEDDGRATALVLLHWHHGERRDLRLADLHPHGRWMEWLHR
jgi:hypothetical protein